MKKKTVIMITFLVFLLSISCIIDTKPIPTPIETDTTTEEQQPIITEQTNEESSAVTINACENLGNTYEHNGALGEIRDDYIGSWHASPSIGSGYNERFVFFPTGNYLFFPSQLECGPDDESCTPSPIEEGTWGILDGLITLAIEGDINNARSVEIGRLIDSPADESPYSVKTSIDGITYWLISNDTNMWNPETGESCD